MTSHVAIVGGGIVGLLAAWELARAGARVTVLERGAAPREASWAGGGILMPLCPWDAPPALQALLQYSQRAYPSLAAELGASTGIDPEWTRSGALLLGHAAGAGSDWARGAGWRLERLDAQALARIEPHVHAPGGALHLPQAAQVRNPRLLRALLAHLPRIGVEVRCGVPAALERVGDRVRVVTLQELLEPDAVVVTAGAWSGALLEPLGIELPVEPMKGEMLLLQPRSQVPLLQRLVIQGEHYLVPRRDGQILVGSTVERAGFGVEPTAAARAELLAFAHAVVPDLHDAGVAAQWAGLRPGSPDGLPFIGRVPGFPNLYVCAGHFRLGLTLAPASAWLVTDLLLGRPPLVPLEPFRVGRDA